MIEYLKSLKAGLLRFDGEDSGISCPPDEWEIMEKINEIIDYLNGLINVGLLPIPDNYKKEKQ